VLGPVKRAQKGVKKGSKKGSKKGHFGVRFWTSILSSATRNRSFLCRSWVDRSWSVPSGFDQSWSGPLRITFLGPNHQWLPSKHVFHVFLPDPLCERTYGLKWGFWLKKGVQKWSKRVKKWPKTVIFDRFWGPKISGFWPVFDTLRLGLSRFLHVCITCTLWCTTVIPLFFTLFLWEKWGFLAVQKCQKTGFWPPSVLTFTEKHENRFWTRFSRFLANFGKTGKSWPKPRNFEKSPAGKLRVFWINF